MVQLNTLLLKQQRTFIDRVWITVYGGRGGNGLPKFGGVGGKGGDVYVQAYESYSLKKLKIDFPKQRFVGGPGKDSKRFQILGNPGEDTIIKCPPGITASNKVFLGELNRVGDRLLLARGGCGGGPHNGYLGQKGQILSLSLDLKLLADVGFVGYPNAGKSTLLCALSNARPKIANYPFTTIAPNVGTLNYSDLRQVTAADLPGLIDGAHMNYGMGHSFLKHCIRTKILLFVVDIDGFQLNPMTSHRSAFETIMLLNRELELYDEELVLKPAILAVNKSDMDGDNMKFQKLKDEMQNSKRIISSFPDDFRPNSLVKFDAIIPVSAKNGHNIMFLKEKIRKLIDIYHEKRIIKYTEKNFKEDNEQHIIYA